MKLAGTAQTGVDGGGGNWVTVIAAALVWPSPTSLGHLPATEEPAPKPRRGTRARGPAGALHVDRRLQAPVLHATLQVAFDGHPSGSFWKVTMAWSNPK